MKVFALLALLAASPSYACSWVLNYGGNKVMVIPENKVFDLPVKVAGISGCAVTPAFSGKEGVLLYRQVVCKGSDFGGMAARVDNSGEATLVDFFNTKTDTYNTVLFKYSCDK